MLLSLKATFDYLYLPKLIDDEDRFFEYHFCQGESVDKDLFPTRISHSISNFFTKRRLNAYSLI